MTKRRRENDVRYPTWKMQRVILLQCMKVDRERPSRLQSSAVKKGEGGIGGGWIWKPTCGSGYALLNLAADESH